MGNGGGITCSRISTCANCGKKYACIVLTDEPCEFYVPIVEKKKDETTTRET